MTNTFQCLKQIHRSGAEGITGDKRFFFSAQIYYYQNRLSLYFKGINPIGVADIYRNKRFDGRKIQYKHSCMTVTIFSSA